MIASSAQTAAAQAHQFVQDNPEMVRQAASMAHDRLMDTKFGQKIHDGVIDVAAKVSGQDRDMVAAMTDGMVHSALHGDEEEDDEDDDEAGGDDDDEDDDE